MWRGGRRHISDALRRVLSSLDLQLGIWPIWACSCLQIYIICKGTLTWNMSHTEKAYSGITKRPVEDPNYICPRCKGESQPIDGQTVTEGDVNCTMLDVEATFCYLWRYAVLRWGPWLCQMLCGLGKVQETLACPNLQIPLTQDTWQGVRDLHSLHILAKRGDQRNPS